MKSNSADKGVPKNYLRRREQFRIFMLVMALGLVITIMFEVSNPDNWGFLRILTGENGPAQESVESEPAYDEDYDTSYQQALEPNEPVDTVRILPDEPPKLGDDSRFFPGVVPVYLARVKDNYPHRPQETDAWYNLLSVLNANDGEFIRESSTGPVSFVQLFEQPEAYRGELVTIQGSVRRVEKLPAAKNKAGIGELYKLIVKPKDGPTRPLFLYVLELPEGFPEGEEVSEEVEFTGFSYKNWPYLAADVTWIAPVLLARDLTWQRSVPVQRSIPPMKVLLPIAILLGTVTIGLTYVIYRTSRSMFAGLSHQKATTTREAIEQLDRIQPTPPIGSQLQSLADEEAS